MDRNNKTELLLSIITPTFNRGEFLEENILSIKNQDYPRIEHIVIDGGSTDNSIDILKKYEGIYNLKWVSEKDNGCADAMEKGFKMATGDIFCWLDSDDVYLPQTIKTVLEIFRNNPGIDVVFGDILISDNNGKIIDYKKYTAFDPETLVYIGATFGSQTTFWRRNLHRKLGGLNTKYLRASDCDFLIRMSLSGAKFCHVRKFLSIYRRHSGQLTRSLDLCRTEGIEITQKYSDKNLAPRKLKWKKRRVIFKRVLYFIKQGDTWYVLRGILKHIGVL